MQRYLARIPPFCTLPSSVLAETAPSCVLRRFRKGERIFREGDPADAVWIVRHGWVYLMKRTPAGGQATIFAMTRDEAICGISAFDHGTYAASAIAASEAQVIAIPAAMFGQLLERHPAFATRTLLICCRRIRHMAEAISVGQATVEQRIAYVLLRLRATAGRTIPITHHELARMAGTRWETSIRTLSAMKQRGWIATARGRVTVLASARLRALLRHPAAPDRAAPTEHGGMRAA